MTRLTERLGLSAAELPFDHPLNQLDELVLALHGSAYLAGIRVGAAAEHLRLALVTPRQVCGRCHGEGKLWGGSPFRHDANGANEAVCSVCGGQGTIATPAPTLSL